MYPTTRTGALTQARTGKYAKASLRMITVGEVTAETREGVQGITPTSSCSTSKMLCCNKTSLYFAISFIRTK